MKIKSGFRSFEYVTFSPPVGHMTYPTYSIGFELLSQLSFLYLGLIQGVLDLEV